MFQSDRLKGAATFLALLFMWGFCSAGSEADFPVGIAFVKEMAYIPEVDGWEKAKPGQFSVDSQKAGAAWDTLSIWVQKQCAPQTVRGLSCWATKLMAGYKRTPPLKKVSFIPIRIRPDQNKLVFEATADTLPSHEKTITRYLKLYLLYDISTGEIVRVTITIRGDRRE